MTLSTIEGQAPLGPEFHATKNDSSAAVYVNFKDRKFTDLDEFKNTCHPFEVWRIFIHAFDYQYRPRTTFVDAIAEICPKVHYNPPEDIRIILTAELFREFVKYGEKKFSPRRFGNHARVLPPPIPLSESQRIQLRNNSTHLPNVPSQEDLGKGLPVVREARSSSQTSIDPFSSPLEPLKADEKDFHQCESSHRLCRFSSEKKYEETEELPNPAAAYSSSGFHPRYPKLLELKGSELLSSAEDYSSLNVDVDSSGSFVVEPRITSSSCSCCRSISDRKVTGNNVWIVFRNHFQKVFGEELYNRALKEFQVQDTSGILTADLFQNMVEFGLDPFH